MSAGPRSHHPHRATPSAGAPGAADDAVLLRYVGEPGGIEERLAFRFGIPFSAIPTGQIRGRAPWVVAKNLARMRQGAMHSAQIMREFQPDVVFVTGGYVAAPVAWAAWRARIPLLIYLPDLTPGMAIRLTSRLATRVAVSFPEVAPYFPGKAVVTGYPVRSELLEANRETAKVRLGLTPECTVLLVFGGSRGARSVNRALVGVLPALLDRCQVVHISGNLDWEWVSEATAQLPADVRSCYHPFPYLHDEMVDVLAAADLIVARAGASVLGEFPAVGAPSILVPYPYAGRHQAANAAYLADRGAALLLPDSELQARLASTINSLLDAPDRLAEMARAATALAQPDAADAIANTLRQLATGKQDMSQ